MAPVKCQLINPREVEKSPNKPHLNISKTISPKFFLKKSLFTSPVLLSSAVTATASATATLSFSSLPKPHPHAHLRFCCDSSLFLADEVNFLPGRSGQV
nr:hypothetical protein CFP56_60146 [Quercus suber]